MDFSLAYANGAFNYRDCGFPMKRDAREALERLHELGIEWADPREDHEDNLYPGSESS